VWWMMGLVSGGGSSQRKHEKKNSDDWVEQRARLLFFGVKNGRLSDPGERDILISQINC
jgi:hypothetical protein